MLALTTQLDGRRVKKLDLVWTIPPSPPHGREVQRCASYPVKAMCAAESELIIEHDQVAIAATIQRLPNHLKDDSRSGKETPGKLLLLGGD